MKEFDLNILINNKGILNKKIEEFLSKNILKKQKADEYEIKGHIEKAEHNLNFVKSTLELKEFNDWCITGCYYASYHSALALIMTKGYSSKNHLATLCILIKEFYKKELSKQDIEIISNFLDYQDLLFYVESKNKREDATYQSKTKFEKIDVEQLRLKAVLLVSK